MLSAPASLLTRQHWFGPASTRHCIWIVKGPDRSTGCRIVHRWRAW